VGQVALLSGAAGGLLACQLAHASGGRLEGHDRDRGLKMLEIVKEDIRKHHHDPSFPGAWMDAPFDAAAQKIRRAETYDEMFGAIAIAFLELDDWHTFFVPPRRAVQVDYGWTMQMIGDLCLVTGVKPGSDAERKGLRPGDLVQSIDGFVPTRKEFWKVQYLYHVVTPRSGMRLVIQSGSGGPKTLDLLASVKRRPRVVDPYVYGGNVFTFIRLEQDGGGQGRSRAREIGDKVLVWKLPSLELDEKQVDAQMKKARKKPALVLDLRGNPGGEPKVGLRMLGWLFAQDVTAGRYETRDQTEPQLVKARGADAFQGALILLADSETASTAEVVARVIQIEKRGRVIGDRSRGSVLLGQRFEHQIGSDPVLEYSANVPVAELVFPDGQNLERVGVSPDELVVPTPEDLAAGRDPVLARALELAGVPTSPEKAGEMFPIEWDASGDDAARKRAEAELPRARSGSPRGGIGSNP
jgi:C-terminal processing protease CtpA/Prc